MKPEEFEPLLRDYEKRSPHLKVERLTENNAGNPLFLVRATDASVSDDEKYVVLITSFDGGTEKTGPTSAFRLIEFLASDDPEAAGILKKHLLLIVPVMNPEGFFFNKPHPAGVNLYTGNRGALWQLPEMKLKNPEQVPELAAFAELIDRYHPEIHLDLHGTEPVYSGRIMVESTGRAGSNSALNSWDHRLVEAMERRGIEAGFGYIDFEATPQRLTGGMAEFASVKEQMNVATPQIYSGLCGYFRCHTLPLVMEIAWEESALARMKGLLAIGTGNNSDFPEGYPVDVLKANTSGISVMAYGTTPGDRRASRIELWKKQPQLVLGNAYALYSGREFFFCAVGGDGVKQLVGSAKPNILMRREQVLPNLLAAPGMDAPALEQFMKLGPENMFWIDFPDRIETVAPIAGGLRLRCHIQYPRAKILDVRLNGRALREDPADGYSVLRQDGKTLLTVNIPPEKSTAGTLFVVSCAYDGGELRENWQPPQL